MHRELPRLGRLQAKGLVGRLQELSWVVFMCVLDQQPAATTMAHWLSAVTAVVFSNVVFRKGSIQVIRLAQLKQQQHWP
jgi:hypothetical protein